MSFLDLSDVSVGDVFQSKIFKETSYTILDVNYKRGLCTFRNNDTGLVSKDRNWKYLTLGISDYFTHITKVVIDLVD